MRWLVPCVYRRQREAPWLQTPYLCLIPAAWQCNFGRYTMQMGCTGHRPLRGNVALSGASSGRNHVGHGPRSIVFPGLRKNVEFVFAVIVFNCCDFIRPYITLECVSSTTACWALFFFLFKFCRGDTNQIERAFPCQNDKPAEDLVICKESYFP